MLVLLTAGHGKVFPGQNLISYVTEVERAAWVCLDKRLDANICRAL